MKKKMLLVIIVGLFFTCEVMAQAPGDTLWTRTIGSFYDESAYSVQRTIDDGYIIAGLINFGAYDYDFYLVKTNANGDTLWTQHYDVDNGVDMGRYVYQTTDGGYIIVGTTMSMVTYTVNAYVIKTNSFGDTLWTQTYGDSGYCNGMSIEQTSDDGYIIAGYISYPPTPNDFYLVKTNDSGDTLWTRNYGGSEDDMAYSVRQTADNGYIIAGKTGNFFTNEDNTLWTRTYGESAHDVALSIQQTTDNGYIIVGYSGLEYDYNDCYVVKTDANGDIIWTQTYGGVNTTEYASSVQQTFDGGYIIAGWTGSADSDDYDVYLIRLDALGDTLWTRTYGGTNYDGARAVQLTEDCGYIVAGETNSFGLGDFDVWLLKIAGEQIIGDFNSDGYVDATDLQLFGDHWHFVSTDSGWDALYDLVPDNIIDAADLQVFGDHWHEGTPPKSGEGGKDGKGPNEFAGIVFDLDALTPGNQNLTSIPSQPAGTYIPVDVYCTGVSNLDTYEFEVIYDATELTYVSSSATNPTTYEQNILTTLGGTALGWMVDYSTPGVLSIAYTLAGNDPAQAPEGEGLIADIVFQALVNTYGTLSFGDVYYYDSFGVRDLITDTGTATLPVELSTFNAFYNTVSGFVSLFWATSSETDVNGFNIYRNTEDVFGEADKINIDLIAGSGTTTEPTEYSFTDETADPYYTTYYYWLQVINFSGINDEFGPYKYIPIDVNQDGELGIITSILSPCYPNPARIGNEISFNFRVGGLEGTVRDVELKVYNILGKLVAEVVSGERLVNDYTETWKPENLSNGVYFYQLKTENYSEVKKMLIQ